MQFFFTCNYALARENTPRATLLLVDRLSLEDLREYAGPELKNLMDESGLSLLNTRAGRRNSESRYLSIATGSRSTAGTEAGLFFNQGEKYEQYPAEILYQRFVGCEPEGEIFCLSFHQIVEQNDSLDNGANLSFLGDILKERKMQVAVWGNADNYEIRRLGGLLGMNREGIIEEGLVSKEILQEDPYFPFGHRMDGDLLAEMTLSSQEHNDLTIVDWGDVARIDYKRNQLTEARTHELMKLTFEELDTFVGSFVQDVQNPDFSHLFVLATPSPPKEGGSEGRQLTPLLINEEQMLPGVLASSTTRRPGLVANLDLAPTILQHLGVEELPLSMDGAPVYRVAENYPLEYIAGLQEQLVRINRQRPALLRGYLAFLITVMLAGGIALFSAYFLRLHSFLRGALDFAIIFPLALLILVFLPGFPFADFVFTVLAVILGTLLLTYLLRLIRNLSNGQIIFWMAMGLFTSLFLLADLAGERSLQEFSFLGYDLISGSRYYGTGNEYMGIIIGSTILGSSALLELCSPLEGRSYSINRLSFMAVLILIGVYLLVGIFFLGSSAFGANAGGTITAVIAYGVAFTGFLRMTFRVRINSLAGIAAAGLMLAIFWLISDWGGGVGSESWHLQTFWDQWYEGGFAAVENIIWRKISMNITLLRYSVWSYLLVALMGVMVFLFYYPRGRIKEFKKQRQFLFTGITAIVTGSVVAFLVNDSGVVAAATTLLYAVIPLLSYYLQPIKSNSGEI